MNFSNNVVVITGASAGIGKDIAQRLAAEKAKVILAARSEDKLQQLSDELTATGAEVLAVKTDVSDPKPTISCRRSKQISPAPSC
jgi:NADP-dependent 3-hydroxy acid dehydrogenase YdfG